MDAEKKRLQEIRDSGTPWKKWGPYLSERQWGTVREDYSENGNAWDYFPHDHARSRAYHWGEDGLAGISDEKQRLCFALALWNGRDPILKERLFGLTNSEGNHGEDVKEYYFYLDNTPTHSYMHYLYKYPQSAYPYDDLVKTNRNRSRSDLEYELLDSGVFDGDRYFDIDVEYAKADPGDILIHISVTNRGPQASCIHLLPTLWYRNTWSWWKDSPKPSLQEIATERHACRVIRACDPLGDTCFLHCSGNVELLFTENETNEERLSGKINLSPYVKDGINDYIVGGRTGAVNPEHLGTKVSVHLEIGVAAGETQTQDLRLCQKEWSGNPFGEDFAAVFATRREEADFFYESIMPPTLDEDARQVTRQALAGLLWTKQYYFFEVDKWLEEHGASPLITTHLGKTTRNKEWFHMVNNDIISMPDKWEYPWFAAWDLAFHAVAFSLVDIDFAKEQMDLIFRDYYLHPSGQIPAYEWNFSDVNPPVHAWAAWYLYSYEKQQYGRSDSAFLRRAFHKLLLNFTWWVNRKDQDGSNVFEGGFLGLDNIGVFDRSAPLPTGGFLDQADGTAWMAFFCTNMIEITAELAEQDPTYEDMLLKFVEHFLWIASAMDRIGNHNDELWDEEDGFFYDLLRLPDGQAVRLRVRSMVGLIPMCAAVIFEKSFLDRFPQIQKRLIRFLGYYPELIVNLEAPTKSGVEGRRLLAILNEKKLHLILRRLLDEEEFLSPYGIRSLSQCHRERPYVFSAANTEYRVSYLPAESDSGVFGGNSNWRGPIWMPINALVVRSLLIFHQFYGSDFKVECPAGSGRCMDLSEVAQEIMSRLMKIFVRGQDGRRPVYGGTVKFQEDPHWRDHILFFEYFNGDNGAGLGAGHQTGWTAMIAHMMLFAHKKQGHRFL